MGCDIHTFVEFKTKNAGSNWRAFSDEIHLDRYYGIFAALVGVRNYDHWGITPVSAPRGAPEDIDYPTRTRYSLWITEHEGEGNCTKEKAEKWVADGESRYLDDRHISNPDWHNASWVNSTELEQAINTIKNISKPEEFDAYRWLGALELMKGLEKHNLEVRMVFWFDN